MLRLTRSYPFCASHRLHVDALSEQENFRLFDKCNNPYGHGHNYVLEVTLEGEPDPETGLLIGRREIDQLVAGEIVPRIDHKDMNCEVAEFEQLNPTTENLLTVIRGWLLESWCETGLARARPVRLRLLETRKNSFTLDLESAGLE